MLRKKLSIEKRHKIYLRHKKIFKKFKAIVKDSQNKFKYINNHNKCKWVKVAN